MTHEGRVISRRFAVSRRAAAFSAAMVAGALLSGCGSSGAGKTATTSASASTGTSAAAAAQAAATARAASSEAAACERGIRTMGLHPETLSELDRLCRTANGRPEDDAKLAVLVCDEAANAVPFSNASSKAATRRAASTCYSVAVGK